MKIIGMFFNVIQHLGVEVVVTTRFSGYMYIETLCVFPISPMREIVSTHNEQETELPKGNRRNWESKRRACCSAVFNTLQDASIRDNIVTLLHLKGEGGRFCDPLQR